MASTRTMLPAIEPRPLSIVSGVTPRGDWRIGAPFYFCAVVQFAALVLAWLHFSAERRARIAAAPRAT